LERIYPPDRFRPLEISGGGINEFSRFFGELKKTWIKIERLQEYDESYAEGYQAFKRGDYAAARRLAQEMVKGQIDVYSVAKERNLKMIRIRIYDLPITSYLRYYEIPCYEADIECGEEIRFVFSGDIHDLLEETNISDYVVFDDVRVVALLYDVERAALEEARLVEDRDLIGKYLEVTSQLIERSVPMKASAVYKEMQGSSSPTS
jgi:hypothetical protein